MREMFESMTKEEIIDWMEERFADLDWWDLWEARLPRSQGEEE